MKKKTVLALALASAMVVPTVGHIASQTAVYAEEEKVTVESVKALIEELKSVDADIESCFSEDESVTGKIVLKSLDSEDLKDLEDALKDAKVVLQKEVKLTGYKAIGKNILEDIGNAKEADDKIGDKDLIVYRAENLKALEETEGEAVKKAEKAFKEAEKARDDSYNTKDFDKITEANNALKVAEKKLNDAKSDYVNKMNEILTNINKSIAYKNLSKLGEKNEDLLSNKIEEVFKHHKVKKAQKNYLTLNKLYSTYNQTTFEKAKVDLTKQVSESETKLVSKVTDKLKDESDALKNAVKDYISGKSATTRVVVATKTLEFGDVLTSEEVKAHRDLVAQLNALTKLPTEEEVKTARKAYDDVYKEYQDAKKLSSDTKEEKSNALKGLKEVVESNKAMVQFTEYGVYKNTLESAKTKLDEKENALKDATTSVKTAKENLEEKEAEFEKDKENQVLAEEVKNLKTALESAEKAEKDAKDAVESQKAYIKTLEEKFNNFYKAFKDYTTAVIKGVGSAELDAKKKELEESLKAYNNFAKEMGLSQIELSRTPSTTKSNWSKLDGKWYYRDKDGKDVYKNAWGKVDGLWYRFDEKGAMLAEQWVKVGEEWYWVNANGRLSQNEWVYVNDEWYWANASGRIAQNEWFYVNENWYWANASGRMAQNEWFESNGVWYYAKEDGKMACNETLEVNGTEYSFDESGALAE